MAYRNWKEGTPYTPGQTPGLQPAELSIEDLAKRAAAHYQALRDTTPAGTPVRIHVFPVKRTGHAQDFRRHLAASLLHTHPDGLGDYYAHTLDAVRIRLETRAQVTQGYIFEEVDSHDYI